MVILLVLYHLEIANPYNTKRIITMNNPFTLEVAIGADNLVNRKNEMIAVKEALSNGSKLFVIGPRRFGKTSLILTAA